MCLRFSFLRACAFLFSLFRPSMRYPLTRRPGARTAAEGVVLETCENITKQKQKQTETEREPLNVPLTEVVATVVPLRRRTCDTPPSRKRETGTECFTNEPRGRIRRIACRTLPTSAHSYDWSALVFSLMQVLPFSCRPNCSSSPPAATFAVPCNQGNGSLRALNGVSFFPGV